MAQRLHLLCGGELIDPSRTEFRDTDNIHVVGIFPDYKSAHAAWKAEAQRTVLGWSSVPEKPPQVHTPSKGMPEKTTS